MQRVERALDVLKETIFAACESDGNGVLKHVLQKACKTIGRSKRSERTKSKRKQRRRRRRRAEVT
jgi:hypothetical protein